MTASFMRPRYSRAPKAVNPVENLELGWRRSKAPATIGGRASSGEGRELVSAGFAKGVSLWLMPRGAARVRLAALIARLAARFGTPAFAPHVTLLAGIEASDPREVLEGARALAGSLSPSSVRLGGIEGGDEHFRCLFARAVLDRPLRAAHAAASRAFGREPDPGFQPHLSLVYGALPQATKQGLAAELEGSLVSSFEVVRLHVWLTSGSAFDWHELGAYELSG